MKKAYLYALLILFFPLAAGGGERVVSYGVIIIDPGHGGIDSGITAPLDILEKDVALQLAKDIARRIPSAIGGVRAVLTRTSDVFVAQRDRAAVAYKYRPSVFISLHLGWCPDEGMNEVFVFYPPASADVSDSMFIPVKDSASAYARESLQLADALCNSFKATKDKENNMLPGCIMSAPAHLSAFRGVRSPAVVLELGCLSVDSYRDMLAERSEPEYDRLIDAVVVGIREFVE